MKFKFTLRPLTLDVEHEPKRRVPIFQFTNRPDFQLYRAATRHIVGDLLAENRRLRGRYGWRKATWRSELIAMFDRWLAARYPPSRGIADPTVTVPFDEPPVGP